MNKNSQQRCRLFNLHLNKLFISLLSTFIFIIIGTVSASAANPVKGVVTDAKSNEALIGVSIKVEGSSVGTITDTNGAFRIETPTANSVLVVSYIGYNTQKVNAKRQFFSSLLKKSHKTTQSNQFSHYLCPEYFSYAGKNCKF